MKTLIIRPREGKSPTYQLVEFTGHDFNLDFGQLPQVLGVKHLDCKKEGEFLNLILDEDREDKPEYSSWYCAPLRRLVKGPVALVSHCDLFEATPMTAFANSEVLHVCQEAGYEEWPSI